MPLKAQFKKLYFPPAEAPVAESVAESVSGSEGAPVAESADAGRECCFSGAGRGLEWESEPEAEPVADSGASAEAEAEAEEPVAEESLERRLFLASAHKRATAKTNTINKAFIFYNCEVT